MSLELSHLFTLLNDLLAELLVQFVVLKHEHFALRLDELHQRQSTVRPLFTHCATDACRQD